jgi:hypothetical protein
MQCAFCGRQITGETKIKKTGGGARTYCYYRCTHYNQPGHPRVRVTEQQIDQQVLALFDKIRIQDDAVRDWFRAVLKSKTHDSQKDSRAQSAELERQKSLLIAQQDRLLNLRIDDKIDDDTFGRKSTEIRDRIASIKLQIDALDRNHDESAELALRVFELSQVLRQKWLTADYAEKRKILEIVLLNCRLDGATLIPTIRKPFDVLAEEHLVPQSGG